MSGFGLFLVLSLLVPVILGQAPWPMPGRDSSLTSASPATPPVINAGGDAVGWCYRDISLPAYANNESPLWIPAPGVYVTYDGNRTLSVYRTRTDSVTSFALPDFLYPIAADALGEMRLYNLLGAFPSNLSAVSIENGSVIWTGPSGTFQTIYNSYIDVLDGWIQVPGPNTTYYLARFAGESGEVLWSVAANSCFPGTPLLGLPNGGLISIEGWGYDTLVLRSNASGEVVWQAVNCTQNDGVIMHLEGLIVLADSVSITLLNATNGANLSRTLLPKECKQTPLIAALAQPDSPPTFVIGCDEQLLQVSVSGSGELFFFPRAVPSDGWVHGLLSIGGVVFAKPDPSAIEAWNTSGNIYARAAGARAAVPPRGGRPKRDFIGVVPVAVDSDGSIVSTNGYSVQVYGTCPPAPASDPRWVIIGCAAGGVVILVLAVALVVWYCDSPRREYTPIN